MTEQPYTEPNRPQPPYQAPPAQSYGPQFPPARPMSTGRSPLVGVAVLVAVVVLLATAGWLVWDNVVREDTGVAACEAMRDAPPAPDGQAKVEMTEAEYRTLRAQFEDSRHDNIREHGTALIDVVWQVNRLPEDDQMAVLALMGPLMEQWLGLQSACADEGIILKLNS